MAERDGLAVELEVCTRMSPLEMDVKMALYIKCARDLFGGTLVKEKGKEV